MSHRPRGFVDPYQHRYIGSLPQDHPVIQRARRSRKQLIRLMEEMMETFADPGISYGFLGSDSSSGWSLSLQKSDREGLVNLGFEVLAQGSERLAIGVSLSIAGKQIGHVSFNSEAKARDCVRLWLNTGDPQKLQAAIPQVEVYDFLYQEEVERIFRAEPSLQDAALARSNNANGGASLDFSLNNRECHCLLDLKPFKFEQINFHGDGFLLLQFRSELSAEDQIRIIREYLIDGRSYGDLVESYDDFTANPLGAAFDRGETETIGFSQSWDLYEQLNSGPSGVSAEQLCLVRELRERGYDRQLLQCGSMSGFALSRSTADCMKRGGNLEGGYIHISVDGKQTSINDDRGQIFTMAGVTPVLLDKLDEMVSRPIAGLSRS